MNSQILSFKPSKSTRRDEFISFRRHSDANRSVCFEKFIVADCTVRRVACELIENTSEDRFYKQDVVIDEDKILVVYQND